MSLKGRFCDWSFSRLKGLDLVMSVVDLDFEMLEAFLDGGLSEAQAEAVRQKLASDPAFGKALEELVAERSTREQFYASLQRHDSDEDQLVDRLLAGVEKALDQDEHRRLAASDRRRMIRYISAAAACVLFSFSAGWIGHRHVSDQPMLMSQNMNQAEIGDSKFGIGTMLTSLSRPGGNGGAGDGVAAESYPKMATPSHSGVDVALTDPAGRVLARQHFDSADDAREFVRDVGQWQQQQLRRSDSPMAARPQTQSEPPLETELVKEHF